jgi:hypothetical protein
VDIIAPDAGENKLNEADSAKEQDHLRAGVEHVDVPSVGEDNDRKRGQDNECGFHQWKVLSFR